MRRARNGTTPSDLDKSGSNFWKDPKEEKMQLIGRENGYDGCLYQAEFAYLDEKEKERLAAAAQQALAHQANKGIKRILTDISAQTLTFLLFTYDQGQRSACEQAIKAIEETTGIPHGMITDNIEKKTLYVYRLDEEEELLVGEIIKLKKKRKVSIGPGLVGRFQWVDFEQTVQKFNQDPAGYTDAFVPFLSESTIVEEIKETCIP